MPGFYRLLLVEDNSDDVFLFMRAAVRALPNFQVLVAGDGEEAKDLMLTSDADLPDVVVTDVKMPRWNGFDLVHWMRAQLHLKTIPTCILSSSLEPRDVELCYAAGANLYLVKPSGFREYSDLLEIIRQFWEHPKKTPYGRLVRLPSRGDLTYPEIGQS